MCACKYNSVTFFPSGRNKSLSAFIALHFQFSPVLYSFDLGGKKGEEGVCRTTSYTLFSMGLRYADLQEIHETTYP